MAISADSNTYHPKPTERLLLEAYKRGEDTSNIKAFCAAAGAADDTYYRMRNNPVAWEWWLRETEEATRHQRSNIYNALTRGAIAGDAAKLKIWLERFDSDYAPRSRRETSGRLLIEAKERRALPDWQQHALKMETQEHIPAPGGSGAGRGRGTDGCPSPQVHSEEPAPQDVVSEGDEGAGESGESPDAS